MSLRINVSLTRIADVIKGVKQINDQIPIILFGGTQETLAELIRHMREYPPTSEANEPPAPYWIRGVGRINKKGKINQISQDTRNQWVVEIRKTRDETVAIGRNNSTYAPWLHLEATQTRVHRRRKWPTIEKVAKRLGLLDLVSGTTLDSVNARTGLTRSMRKIARLFDIS